MNQTSDAIATLKAMLEFNPTDPEGWSELADLYLSQGIYAQAIFSLEEALVLMPNAWNVSLSWTL
jgi:cytochrome c-type biogenesis protein CcmH/NrfG